ncbi:hypothetical protein I5G67_gp101 [Mycobacterium phage Aminay]|uniref:Uncharacterized protein n=1 Tax=Mycobacterium phage Aminay TaxID=2250291 RepID=A0A345KV85_9CAUD|nr:hypothetical protein I5G67_gp101 [Mycobacterium phage Aminay]AXH46937.1 hypothetical protein SEA_AMINAY_101 [Mycobacterium phage Aminay]
MTNYLQAERDQYRLGRRLARELFNKACPPAWDLLGAAHREFVRGLRSEWDYLTAYGAVEPGSHRVDLDTGNGI